MTNQTPLNKLALSNLRRLADQATSEVRYAVIEPDILHKLLDMASPGETINNITELDALPVGSIIIDKHGDAGLIDRLANGETYVQYAETAPMSIGYVAKHYLPVTVLNPQENHDD